MILRVSRRLLCVAATVAAAGCLSPTLPLPPPSEPVATGPTAAGLLRLRGSAPERSWMHAYNHDTGNGAFQEVRRGRYDFTIGAAVGDRLVLWYAIDGEESLPLDWTVKAQP